MLTILLRDAQNPRHVASLPERAMDAINEVFNRPLPDLAAVLKANDIDSSTQQHLLRVYATLAVGVLCTAGGVVLGQLTGLSGGVISLILVVATLFWLMLQSDKENTPKRLGIFALFTAAQGLSIAGFVDAIMYLDPSILVTAGLGSFATFACFSGFAVFSKRRSLLYIGGIVSSALSMLLWYSLFSRWFGVGLLSAELYIGLAIFVGYVVFDTQLIVEKAAHGDKDFVGHAVGLYLDLVNIFIRIATILAKNKKSSESSSERRSSSSRR